MRRWLIVVTLVLGWWAYKADWLHSDFRLTSYSVPSGGPKADVHPEVLNLQSSFSNVAELVKPAVVSISTVHIEQVSNAGPEFFFGDPLQEFFQNFMGQENDENPYGRPRMRRPNGKPREFKTEGVGSGVIIDPDGLVLTNDHVVREASEIKVIVIEKGAEKKEYIGKVVGKDPRTDLAVVRIKAGHKLPYAALGDSERVKVGDWAIAIGSPFGLAQTVTVGVVSASNQTLSIEGHEYRNLLQTDAAINRGNSGGPLLNIRGEVVGINTAIYAPTGVFAGIGFAVPVNQVKEILDDLIHKGHVIRGWLGVELAREISPAIAKSFGLPDTKGALVTDVMKDSPASKAGLKRGDVVRRFDGKDVESPDKLQAMVAVTAPKKAIPMVVIREKKEVTLTVVLGERPDSADERRKDSAKSSEKEEKTARHEWKGIQVMKLTPDLGRRFRQPDDASGVIVVDVADDSPLAELGLAVGDVIRSVNQQATPDTTSFEKATSKVNLKDGVVLDVLRQGHPMYLSVTLG